MAARLNFKEDLYANYSALAICTHLKAYKLLWIINKDIKTEFRKIDDFPYSENITFPLFYFDDKEFMTELFLIQNKTGSSVLFSAHQQADFLFLANRANDGHFRSIEKKIKSIQNVLKVYYPELNKIKSINPFLEDLEMCVLEYKKKEREKELGK